jgi:molybdopterin converting factor small subunit
MVTVRLPAMLRQDGGDTLLVEEPVSSVGMLVDVLSRRVPGFSEKFADAILNFAVNDDLVLHDLLQQPLRDGDRVEIVPTISGG